MNRTMIVAQRLTLWRHATQSSAAAEHRVSANVQPKAGQAKAAADVNAVAESKAQLPMPPIARVSVFVQCNVATRRVRGISNGK